MNQLLYSILINTPSYMFAWTLLFKIRCKNKLSLDKASDNFWLRLIRDRLEKTKIDWCS